VKSCQLTARKVSAATKPGYYGDGGGLYLQVSQYGTRSWVFRFTSPDTRKIREMGLGSDSTFSLKEARERARECRQLIANDIDPIEARLKKRDEARNKTGERILFKEAAERFVDVHEQHWKNEKHRAQWRTTLEAYVYPTLGKRPIAAIDGALITETLTPIWTDKIETARRVKQRIERVIEWVKNGTPLPTKGASKRVRHHPAMPFAQVPAFMDDLGERGGISARALEFTILTVARTADTIGAMWPEIDLDAGVWTVSDGRHKTGKDFEIPLSKRAIQLLQALPRERAGYVFPGAKAKKPLNSMAMLEQFQSMKGCEGFTVHGFRSSFRDWAGDRTNFAREVIEAAMSHQIKDKAEASYRRSTALEKRRRLMEEWAKYCSSPTQASGQVVAMHG
jgi:integrase